MLTRMRGILASLKRQLSGGGPAPEAINELRQFLSTREEWTCEDWTLSLSKQVPVSNEVATFAYDFFTRLGVPFGRTRAEDYLKRDLHFDNALWRDWELDLVEELEVVFGVRVARLRRWPTIDTLADLLVFLESLRGPQA